MEVDIKILKDYNISPNQYILSYLLHKNDYIDFHNIKNLIGEEKLIEELSSLEDKGFIEIKKDSDPLNTSNIKVRNKFLFIIEEGDYFDELLESYPTKVFRPDGTKDYLRSDVRRCRKNYNKIASSRKKHERILKALEFEKKIREMEGSWKYMKKLPKWLSSEEWRIFEERMKDEQEKSSEGQLGYGHSVK